MALFTTPEAHAANPPESWEVSKAADRVWRLAPADAPAGAALDTFTTKAKAEAAKVSGWLVDLYEKEGRWYAGETVTGWRPYADVAAEHARLAARRGHGLAGAGAR